MKQFQASLSTVRKIARNGVTLRPPSHRLFEKNIIVELFMYIALNRYVTIPTLAQSSIAMGLNDGKGYSRDVMYRFRKKYFVFKSTRQVPLLTDDQRILRERFARLMLLNGETHNDRIMPIHVDEKSFIVGIRPKRVAIPRRCSGLFEMLKFFPVLNKNKPTTCMVYVAVGRPLGENGERFDGRVAFIPVADENFAKKKSENKDKGDPYDFSPDYFSAVLF